MASKLLDPRSNDTKPVFLRNVYDDVTELSERDRRKHRVLKIRLFKEKGLVGTWTGCEVDAEHDSDHCQVTSS
jgi:hypothetical protein